MTKEIVLFGGEIALCDDEDYPLLSRFKWSYNGKEGNKYVRAGGDRKSGNQVGYYMHRLVCAGKSPDHINFNTLDNRKENLRIATHQENGWNKRKNRGCSTGNGCSSAFKGVMRCTGVNDRVYWRVLIKLSKKGEIPARFARLGPFDSEIAAARAYNEEIIKHRGKWAWLNPIPEAN